MKVIKHLMMILFSTIMCRIPPKFTTHDKLPKVPPISGCTFLNVEQWDNFFLPVREIIFPFVAQNIRNLTALSEEQKEIRDKNFDDIIEAATIHHYNMIACPRKLMPEWELLTPDYSNLIKNIRLYMDELVKENTMDLYDVLSLSNISLKEIPVDVIKFFRPLGICLANTGISDISVLSQYTDVVTLQLSHNNFTKLPDFEKFENLEKVYLSDNLITISDINEIKTNGKITHVELEATPDILAWKEELEKTYGNVQIDNVNTMDLPVMYGNENVPTLKDTITMSIQELVLEFMRQVAWEMQHYHVTRFGMRFIERLLQRPIWTTDHQIAQKEIQKEIHQLLRQLVDTQFPPELENQTSWAILTSRMDLLKKVSEESYLADDIKQQMINEDLLILFETINNEKETEQQEFKN